MDSSSGRLGIRRVRVTASVVLWNKDEKPESLVSLFLDSGVVDLVFVVDNSCGSYSYLSEEFNGSVFYINPGSNLGFGAGHNVAFREAIKLGSRYHFLSNPDISFDPNILKELLDFIRSEKEAGIVAPKVFYPDGCLQYTCRLLPSPWQLFKRRFLGLEGDLLYELRFTGYSKVMRVPFIIGCFWLLNMEAVAKVGFFDERYFLYMEDVDLCRRVFKRSKIVFYPHVAVIHEHRRDSYKNLGALLVHVGSAIKYFNKWGWFQDREREEINAEILSELGARL